VKCELISRAFSFNIELHCDPKSGAVDSTTFPNDSGQFRPGDTVSSYDVSTGNYVTITLLWSVVLITVEDILLKKVHKELI